MSKTGKPNHRRQQREQGKQFTTRPPKRERHITVRSIRRTPPDLGKLSRAVIALAMAEMEAEKAAAEKADATAATQGAATSADPTPETPADMTADPAATSSAATTIDHLKAALPVVASPTTTTTDQVPTTHPTQSPTMPTGHDNDHDQEEAPHDA